MKKDQLKGLVKDRSKELFATGVVIVGVAGLLLLKSSKKTAVSRVLLLAKDPPEVKWDPNLLQKHFPEAYEKIVEATAEVFKHTDLIGDNVLIMAEVAKDGTAYATLV